MPKSTDEHFSNTTTQVKMIFDELDHEILWSDSRIKRYTTSGYIAYKRRYKLIEVEVQKERLKLYLRTTDQQMIDPLKLTSKTDKWGNLNRIVFIDPNNIPSKYTLKDIISLVKQSINSLP